MSKHPLVNCKSTNVVFSTANLFSGTEAVVVMPGSICDTEFIKVRKTFSNDQRDTFDLTITKGRSVNLRNLVSLAIDRDGTVFVFWIDNPAETLWRISKTSHTEVLPEGQRTAKEIKAYAAELFETASFGNSGLTSLGGRTWHVKVIATKNDKGAYTNYCVEGTLYLRLPERNYGTSGEGTASGADTPMPSPTATGPVDVNESHIPDIDEDLWHH